jgi:hypothetical protein
MKRDKGPVRLTNRYEQLLRAAKDALPLICEVHCDETYEETFEQIHCEQCINLRNAIAVAPVKRGRGKR